ncbi:MAG: L-rhamnose mutarotase [Candidatus Omnitrophota bacterium]
MLKSFRRFLFIAAGLLLIGCAQTQPKIQRYGMVIGIKPEKIEYYKKLHANPWPGVITKLKDCHVRNYSIYLRQVNDKDWFLFGYLEYDGKDFDADMAKMAADAETQRWWKETDPCQIPLPNRKPGDQWSIMEEVFHMD